MTSCDANPATAWVRTLSALLLAAAATAAQAGDAARGRLLFEFTSATTGNATLQRCSDCHRDFIGSSNGSFLDPVVGLRRSIGGSPFPVISVDLARSRLSTVGLNQPEMEQFKTTLSTQDLDDLAAYIADTPRTSVDALQLSASAVQGSDSGFITLTHSTATTFPLIVASVVMVGSDASAFVASGCLGQTLTAGNQCTVQVQFTAADTSRRDAQVFFTLLQQGRTINRTVAVTGGVAGVTPPSSGGGLNPNPGNTGGGALGGAWLAAMAAAALVARRTARKSSR